MKPLALALLLCAVVVSAHADSDPEAVAEGEYLLRASGCVACHTTDEGAFLAGGTAIESPFGTFFGPNITPDPEHGIGTWSEDDFIAALREGVGPDGRHYYPAFPYTSYTRLNVEDMRSLWAYLQTVPASDQRNRAHDLPWWVSFRIVNRVWKWLFFEPGPFEPDPAQSAEWNRGAYLAIAAGHCGECHTPRDWLGAPVAEMWFAGSRDGPEGATVPNITPDAETGIGRWREAALVRYLGSGLAPGGDIAGGMMAEVIDEGLRYLSEEDLQAIAAYLLALPPVENEVRPPAREREPSDDPFG